MRARFRSRAGCDKCREVSEGVRFVRMKLPNDGPHARFERSSMPLCRGCRLVMRGRFKLVGPT